MRKVKNIQPQQEKYYSYKKKECMLQNLYAFSNIIFIVKCLVNPVLKICNFNHCKQPFAELWPLPYTHIYAHA